MYVCLCNGLSDRQIRAAAVESDGSVDAVFARLGAKRDCGQCVPVAARIIQAARKPRERSRSEGSRVLLEPILAAE